MSPGHKRLSDKVIPGRDYPAKVKIEELLDHEVLMLDFTNVVIMKDVVTSDGEKLEVEDANYWNVNVDDAGTLKTFSTGATQIVSILKILDKADLPLLCEFSKEGRNYVVK